MIFQIKRTNPDKPACHHRRHLIPAGILTLLLFANIPDEKAWAASENQAPDYDNKIKTLASPADGSKLRPYVKPETEQNKNGDTGSEKAGSADEDKEIEEAVKSIVAGEGEDIKRRRKDKGAARKLARVHWLDRIALANPRVIEAIVTNRKAAKILAAHPRLGAIAAADHYLCRRLTKWKSVARILARNGQAQKVIAYDPAGIYYAIKRDRRIVKILSKNPNFNQMIVEDPELGRVLAQYM